jgi:fused signal recognition particle receptor
VEILVVVALVAALIVVVYFVLAKKRAAPSELEAPEKPRALPATKEPGAPPRPQPAPKPAEPKPVAPRAVEPERSEPTLAREERHATPPPPQPAESGTEPRAEEALAARAPEREPAPAAEPAPPKAASARARPAHRADVAGLRKGLVKVREKEGLFGRLKALFAGKKELDPNVVEQIEEVLLGSDVGVKTTQMLLDELRGALDRKEIADTDRVWEALRDQARRVLAIGDGGIELKASPTVVMVVGVNGAGKTTTIGKLATRFKAEGKQVVLAAGDTFRAAAVQQLAVWAKRVGCEIVSGKDGANPGAVLFDAIQKARDIGADIVLADTAGRLHTKTNLMDELKKVERTMAKAMDGAPHETLLVLDATNGQNAMQQAAMFKEALRVTGIVLTKLDGTAKGGVILGICSEHGLPVRYVGIGERAEDLREFDADEFVEAMLGQGDAAEAA